MADKIKLGLAFLLVAAGVAGFYYLHDSPPVVKLLVVLVGLVLAAVVARTSNPGRRFFVFAGESVAESKRVVWPSRKETIQTTAVVIAFAVTMALFLWAVDASLMVAVNNLMGRSE